MLDFSKPDPPRTPERERKRKSLGMWALAGFLWAIFFLLDDHKWLNQYTAQAAILGIPTLVMLAGWIISIPLLYLLLVAVHEGGHVLGALLAQFRVVSYVVSWLHITHRAAGWKVQFKKPSFNLGGMVQAFPSHTHNLRRRFALLIVGGPLANLVTGALALYFHYAYPTAGFAFFIGEYLLHGFLAAFGWMSIVVGALNLIPRALPSGHIVDGKRLWDLAKGGPAMFQQVGMMYFQSLMYAGVRPRDWEQAQVEQFLAYRSNSVLDCYAHQYAYSYHHDRNDLEQLSFHLNEALNRRTLAPVATQQHLLAEAAYVAALHTHDAEKARHWLNCAQEVKPFTKEEGLFSQAAVAYVEGRHDEAATWLQASRRQLSEAVSTGGTLQALERLDDLQTRIQKAQGQLQPA